MKLVKNNKKKGFTLIELVVVIAILAILALILIPTISGYIGSANDSRDQANARNLYTAAVLAVETTTASTETEILTAAAKYGDFTSGSPKVTVTSGVITSVQYGSWEFDGKAFTKK